jgi:PEGA domain
MSPERTESRNMAQPTSRKYVPHTRLRGLRQDILMWLCASLLSTFFTMLCLTNAWGQAAAEYGGMTSSIGIKATPLAPLKAVLPEPKPATKGDYLPLHASVDVDAVNRHKFEQDAGKDGASLMLRSVPSNASVRINEKPVGQTPLLLTLPAGVYKVDMEGDRLETGHSQIDLLPREKREFVLTLKSRYPTIVRLP